MRTGTPPYLLRHPPTKPRLRRLKRGGLWLCGLIIALTPPRDASGSSLELLTALPLPDGGEIVDYHEASQTLAVTAPRGVRLYDLGGNAEPTPRAELSEDALAAARGPFASVSSAALDPAGRGFGVLAVIPEDRATRRGWIVFFDVNSAEVLWTIEAGFHPDAVVFDADGSRVYVVNEGEFTVGGDRDTPGSVSMIDLRDVTGTGEIGAARFVGDFPFTRWSMAPGVELDALRINDADTTQPYRHVEPEYAAVHGGLVYVTLQENNAVGVFDPERRRWAVLFPLGTVPVTIDASDQDGAPRITSEVSALPMPDTLAVFEAAGRRVIATADEGDFRVDDGDRKRAAEFAGVSSESGIDEAARRDPARLGRLQLSIPDSDPDGDGRLDAVVAAGARGVSLWDADTGERLGGTGSLEAWLFERDPDRHNLDVKNADRGPDSHSDDKGPEPEGLAALTLTDGRVLLAVTLERQNGLVLIDATDPMQPQPTAYRNDLNRGLAAPECARWVRIDGISEPVLLVGYEGNADGQHCGVAIYRLVP